MHAPITYRKQHVSSHCSTHMYVWLIRLCVQRPQYRHNTFNLLYIQNTFTSKHTESHQFPSIYIYILLIALVSPIPNTTCPLHILMWFPSHWLHHSERTCNDYFWYFIVITNRDVFFFALFLYSSNGRTEYEVVCAHNS